MSKPLELEAITKWLAQAAGLKSFRDKSIQAKVARPVVLWGTASRNKDKPLNRYAYTNKVSRFGKLYARTLEEADQLEVLLTQDLDDRLNVLPILDQNGQLVGTLKNVEITFDGDTEGLDIGLKVNYEATYTRTKPAAAPPVGKVTTTVRYGGTENGN